jgi:beta-glucosidase
MTAGFDPSLTHAAGNIIGTESRDVAVHVIEGPGMNMLRQVQGGRSFEFASEDPYLAGLTVSQSVMADQSHGIIGMCKHFLGNDQETNRESVSDILDARTRYEMYLTPFDMCINDGGARSVMCAYNLVNGVHECQDYTTMTTAARTQFGFKGYFQSDFGATNSTVPSLLAGENLEMNTPVWFTPAKLYAAGLAGEINQGTIENALLPRYTEMFAAGDFDRNIVYPTGTPTVSTADAVADGITARLIGEQDSVLFRNANNAAGTPTLPLTCDPNKPQTIAVIGPRSLAGLAYTGGGGSSSVIPLYTVTPLQGLQTVCPTDTIKEYSVASPATGTEVTPAQAQAAAAAANVAIVIEGDEESEGSDRSQIYMPAISGVLPDVLVNDICHGTSPAPNSGPCTNQPNTIVVLHNGDPVPLGDPAVYNYSWADAVPAILETWYGGDEDGNIIADLLFNTCQTGANPSTLGNPSVCTPADPSGKTSITFPVHSADVPQQTLNTNLEPYAPAGWPQPSSIREEFPGTTQALSFPPYISDPPFTQLTTAYPPIYTYQVVNPTYDGPTVYYSEGLQFGYRWYESQNITPRYPFGFGLSYTTFNISDVNVTPDSISTQTAPIVVTARVNNTGRKYGAEVVQVYLGLPNTGNSFGEPPKRLVGFQKVWLNPGESRTVTIQINPAIVPKARPLEVVPLDKAEQLAQNDPDEQGRLFNAGGSHQQPCGQNTFNYETGDGNSASSFPHGQCPSAYQPLAYWDTTANSWAWASGHYTVYVGNSSANTPFTRTIKFTSLSTCNGAFTGTFEGNTTVPSGQTCEIVDGKVTGKVFVQPGGHLTLVQATTGGVVQFPQFP